MRKSGNNKARQAKKQNKQRKQDLIVKQKKQEQQERFQQKKNIDYTLMRAESRALMRQQHDRTLDRQRGCYPGIPPLPYGMGSLVLIDSLSHIYDHVPRFIEGKASTFDQDVQSTITLDKTNYTVKE